VPSTDDKNANPKRKLSIAFSARWRLFHVVWIVRKTFYCYDRSLRNVSICATQGRPGRAVHGRQGHQPQAFRSQRQLSIALSARSRLFHVVWIFSKTPSAPTAAYEVPPSLPPEQGEPSGDSKEGVPMVTGGGPGPVVGEPPGSGKECVSMLTGNGPG
jgi:hypothetical protein